MGAQVGPGSAANRLRTELVDGVGVEGVEADDDGPGGGHLLQAELEVAALGGRSAGDGQDDGQDRRRAGQAPQDGHRAGVGPVHVLDHDDGGADGGGVVERVGEGVGHHHRAVGQHQPLVGAQGFGQAVAVEVGVVGEVGHDAEGAVTLHLIRPRPTALGEPRRRASSTSCVTSVVLPMPASPVTTSVRPRPAAASSSSRRNISVSADRPTGRRSPPSPTPMPARGYGPLAEQADPEFGWRP